MKGNEPIWPVIVSVSSKIGCTAETLRRWVRQAEHDTGKREGFTTDEREELKRLQRLQRLQRENRELKKANEILRLASAFFAKASTLATELDR